MEVERSGPILVVDGEDSTRDQLCEPLRTNALSIEEAKSVKEAIARAESSEPVLVLSEVRLPDASGFSLVRRLREGETTRNLPVILVSEWTTEMDRVIAFECGADDVLARPFFGRELASRVSALLRRRRQRRLEEAPIEEESTPSAAICEVRVEGRLLDLTPKESAILSQLATSDGCVRSRRQLIERIWGPAVSPTDRCIDSHVKSLRRKLGPAAAAVETVRGVGYRYKPHPALQLS